MNAFTQIRRNDQPIYLDYQATTPLDPRVLEVMMPYFTYKFGNPHSRSHSYGWEAEEGVEKARAQVAKLIGADEKEVIFTSGATESNNLAIRGVAEFYKDRKNHVVTTVTEHKCVLDTCRHLEQSGFEVTYLPVQKNGLIDLDVLRAAITDKTVVVSVMAVNNEVGTIQPIDAVAEIVRQQAPAATFHTDAVQAFGWVDPAPIAAAVDAMSLSGHKIGGPKGVGALVWRSGAHLEARQLGGGQERERRAGTHNVAGIVGLVAAARRTHAARAELVDRITKQRDRLVDGILVAVDGVETVDRSVKVAGNAHLCFDGVEAEALLFLLDRADIAASAASSCASGAQGSSHVLAAMGVPRHLAGGSLRPSLGWSTTDAEIDHAIEVIPPAVARLRSTGS